LIYLATSGGKFIVILEPGNLELLREGEAAHTPDGVILIAYTQDAAWTDEQQALDHHCSLAVAEVERILAEGMKRPEVRRPPMKPVPFIINGRRTQ